MRSTVGTHSYANRLLKNTPTKHSKYVVNQNLNHHDYVSFRELFVGIIRQFFLCFFLYQYDLSLPLPTLAILIHATSSTNTFHLSFMFDWGIAM